MTLTTQTFFADLVENAARAISARTPGPEEIFRHDEVLDALEAASGVFPEGYREEFCDPLIATFERIGPGGWFDVLRRDPQLQGAGLMGLDLVQGAAQWADAEDAPALLALQEVIGDLYDGFLSEADRGDVRPPEHGVLAPLVKWGRPGFGPYVWPARSTASYDCRVGLVNMPPAFAADGLAAWAALGHEGAHEILHANTGLLRQLAALVAEKIGASASQAFADEAEKAALADYWAARIDESASDVMGVVNMGPAACIGLIAYFRALSLVSSGEPKLASSGAPDGPHPAPLARCYLMAEAIGACSFSDRAEWRRALTDEGDEDAPGAHVDLGGATVSLDGLKQSARIAARAILSGETEALEGRALQDIQDWRQADQLIVEVLTDNAVIGGAPTPNAAARGVFAAHAVAAAIMASLKTGEVRRSQARMIEIVAEMHLFNPAWSDLAGDHLGDFHGPHFGPGHAVHEALHGGGAPEVDLCDCGWEDGDYGAGHDDGPRRSGGGGGASVPSLRRGKKRTRRKGGSGGRRGPFMLASAPEADDDGAGAGAGDEDGRGGARVPGLRRSRRPRRRSRGGAQPEGSAYERRRARERWEEKAGEAGGGLWRDLLGR